MDCFFTVPFHLVLYWHQLRLMICFYTHGYSFNRLRFFHLLVMPCYDIKYASTEIDLVFFYVWPFFVFFILSYVKLCDKHPGYQVSTNTVLFIWYLVLMFKTIMEEILFVFFKVIIYFFYQQFFFNRLLVYSQKKILFTIS